MGRGGFRWLQICIGLICMVMIANLQYGRTFFVPDIQKAFHWDRSEIQIAFTLFVLFETWLVPIEGWFVDQWGPKVVVLAGGVLAGLGWIMNAYASRLGGLTGYYAAQIIAGVGAVYGTCLGMPPSGSLTSAALRPGLPQRDRAWARPSPSFPSRT